ncbi:MAG: hypothetical protein Q4G40_02250 [Brachybacterium sp.]|nr:hypothetical protein [Brachybacterium sp.]
MSARPARRGFPARLRARLRRPRPVSAVLRTDYDVGAYARAARGRLPVDADAIVPGGLDVRTRADLAFVHRLDAAGLTEMRAVLSTWTANEARVTAFLATWAYERYWCARAIGDVLDADARDRAPGRDPDAPFTRRGPLARVRAATVEGLVPILGPLATVIVGEPLTAGQMARLAVQEASLRAAYRALLPRLDGEARRVVGEVAERRPQMVEFFRVEAAARISRSRAEEISARLHLHRRWRALRVVGVPDPDENRALLSLGIGEEARHELWEADAGLRSRLLTGRATD